MTAPPGSRTVLAMEQIPTSERMRLLERRREQLEVRLQGCQAAADAGDLPNPSLGRVLNDTRSLLAKVRIELARLEPR
jgi:hypothetical protein